MKAKEDLLERIKAVKALADRGERGELEDLPERGGLPAAEVEPWIKEKPGMPCGWN